MRTVHRLSPLDEQVCGWRPGGTNKPTLAAPVPKNQFNQPIRESSEPTPLQFSFEDVPTPLQRTSSIGSNSASTVQPVVDTLQLLLGPSSDAEAMLHMHVKLALELENAHGSTTFESKATSSESPPHWHGSSSSTSSSAGATPTAVVASSQQALDNNALAGIFSRLGYAPKLKTSTLKIAQRRGLTHQYLTVNLPDGTPEGGGTFIVDPFFKDQFMVSSPTPRYAAVMQALDQHIAATKGCLRQAVILLCSELSQCFAEKGLSVPPWRTPAALLARWNL